MAQQANRKHGLSRTAPPKSGAATRVLAVVLLVAAAPLVGGMAGVASAGSGNTAATTGTAGAAVDIVFVFDRSASTNEDRYHMAQEVDRLESRFDAAGINARYGLVTYNGISRVEQPLTSEFDSFEAAMHFPEGGNRENASDAILAATDMDFREGAETVVVVVTDEDDDSSNATRDAALSSLSAFHFIAVSPSSPSESSCSVHSPPCDSRSDNELRTMAGQVGGDWIGQGQPAATIVDGIADTVESTVDTGTEELSTPTPTPSAEFRTTDRSANRTTPEVGDRVRFNKTVENIGTAEGTYEAYLSHGGTVVAEREVSVPAGESRTITFFHRFENPGEYDVLITHDRIATVTATEPNNVSIDTVPWPNKTGLTATVTDAWTNDTVPILVADAGLVPEDVATIETVFVSVGNSNVTPVHDVAFDFEVAANGTPPNGTDPLSEHVTAVRYLTVDSSLDNLAGVQFEYTASPNRTTLYRYDADNTTWAPFNRSVANGTDAPLRTDRSTATLYAVGVRQPALSATALALENRSVEAGDPTSVTVTVSNRGAATGSFNATLRLNGSVLGADAVTVPPDQNRTVVYTVTPDRPGTYTLDVPGGPSTTLQVDATETPTATPTETPTATPTETQATTHSPTASPPSTRTAPGGSTPGFGPVVAVVALAALAGGALLARRRS